MRIKALSTKHHSNSQANLIMHYTYSVYPSHLPASSDRAVYSETSSTNKVYASVTVCEYGTDLHNGRQVLLQKTNQNKNLVIPLPGPGTESQTAVCYSTARTESQTAVCLFVIPLLGPRNKLLSICLLSHC